jgi:hypothetical protein
VADITTYRRALTSYFSTASGLVGVKKDEIRAVGDAVVTANPSYWVALTDADGTGGVSKIHP